MELAPEQKCATGDCMQGTASKGRQIAMATIRLTPVDAARNDSPFPMGVGMMVSLEIERPRPMFEPAELAPTLNVGGYKRAQLAADESGEQVGSRRSIGRWRISRSLHQLTEK